MPGWRTYRKIIVIESDDWGSIRMPSIFAFENLEKNGLDLRSFDAERYNLNDSIETTTDLETLFDVLSGIKNRNGQNPVFTAVSVVANPDFQKIRSSGFKDYYYEPFTETLKKYPGCERSFDLYKEGIQKRLFVPQMHGREHLNVVAWMKALQNKDKETRLAFDEGVWGFVPGRKNLLEVDYQAAFLLSDPEEIEYHKRVIIEGLDLFHRLFGYRAEYFVPPNGPINNHLNKVLASNGIKYMYTDMLQQESIGHGKTQKILHWLGQKEKNGITYTIRNCIFEPSVESKDWVNSCMNDIKKAFRWHKPALIGSHRVNYIGKLNPGNRDRGLKNLKELLSEIIKEWPDVEFMTSVELGDLILKH